MFHDVLNKKRNYFRVKKITTFQKAKNRIFPRGKLSFTFLGENEPRNNVSFCSR